jgi:hypothetical protein
VSVELATDVGDELVQLRCDSCGALSAPVPWSGFGGHRAAVEAAGYIDQTEPGEACKRHACGRCSQVVDHSPGRMKAAPGAAGAVVLVGPGPKCPPAAAGVLVALAQMVADFGAQDAAGVAQGVEGTQASPPLPAPGPPMLPAPRGQGEQGVIDAEAEVKEDEPVRKSELRGKNVVFTGRLEVCDRLVAWNVLRQVGGIPLEDADQADVVVVGNTGKHGRTKKIRSAKGAVHLDERAFWEAVLGTVGDLTALDCVAESAARVAAKGGPRAKLRMSPSVFLGRPQVVEAQVVEELSDEDRDRVRKKKARALARDKQIERIMQVDEEDVFGGEL